MNNLRISGLASYEANGPIDLTSAGQIVKAGFGGRAIEECIEDAKSHLASAQLVQYAHDSNGLIGFAMYETFPGGIDLYLNGIVIDRSSQGKKLGTSMVGSAFSEVGAKRLFAVTRNSAILRLMQSICRYVEPSMQGTNKISPREVERLAGYIALPLTHLPYHRGRYPENLYDKQPRHTDPAFQEKFDSFYQLSNLSDAVLLIGEL